MLLIKLFIKIIAWVMYDGLFIYRIELTELLVVGFHVARGKTF